MSEWVFHTLSDLIGINRAQLALQVLHLQREVGSLRPCRGPERALVGQAAQHAFAESPRPP